MILKKLHSALKITITSVLVLSAWMTTYPKVAILYITTGNYIILFDGFYESMEKNFLPNYQKTYFVFTDDTTKQFPKNVVRIYQKQMPWPYPTLNRFEMFLKIKQKLQKYDYIYFLNGNAEILKPVGPEIFPSKEQGIMVVQHPMFLNTDKNNFSYERNPLSTAYIPYDTGTVYVQGDFNGGRTSDFLKLIRTCDKNVKIDKKNNIIAVWHDESHLNKYILDKKPLLLSIDYNWYINALYASGIEKPKHLKIIMRDKNKFGGNNYLRQIKE